MRLSDRVYLTLSGDEGCSLSHPADCNAYGLYCGDQMLLIDAGVGPESEAIVLNLAGDGVPSSTISSLLLTHAHLDHSGGARWLQERLGVEIVASELAASSLESGDETRIDLDLAKGAGIYPRDIAFKSCMVNRKLRGGERWKVGDVTLLAIATPGHSEDMICYLAQTPTELLAFVGDTVFHGGRALLQATPSCRPFLYAESLRILSNMEIDGLFPGHGLWSLQRGAAQVRKSLAYVDRLLMPPNIL